MDEPQILHASCVSWQGKAVLIKGQSGAGKSTLALELMAFGCDLIADDRTILTVIDGQIFASCPPAILGQIEARGVGLLTAAPCPIAKLVCVAHLDYLETVRLPEPQQCMIMEQPVTLFHKSEQSPFAPAILQYLKSTKL